MLSHSSLSMVLVMLTSILLILKLIRKSMLKLNQLLTLPLVVLKVRNLLNVMVLVVIVQKYYNKEI